MKKLIILLFVLFLLNNAKAQTQYSNADLSGPWFMYRYPLDLSPDSASYIVFDGNGNITDMSVFGSISGTYNVTTSGDFSGTLIIGSDTLIFSGMLTSKNSGDILTMGKSYKLSKISNPGALKDSLKGELIFICGAKVITLQVNSNGEIISGTGDLISPVSGKIYADTGIIMGNMSLFIGHIKTGDTSPINCMDTIYASWDEFTIIGIDNHDTLTGTLNMDGPHNTPLGSVQLIRSGTATQSGLIVNPSANPAIICVGGTKTQLSANVSGGIAPYTYSWSSDASGFTSTLAKPIVAPIINTNYSVTVTGADSKTATGSVTIVVEPNNIEGFEYFPSDTIPNNLMFSPMTFGNIASWYWDFNDNNFSNLQSPTNKFTKDGIYHVCLTVKDMGASCLSTLCKDVTIGNPNCHASFDYSLDSATNTVTFIDQSTGTSLNHYWEFGTGDISNDTNPQYKYIYPGYYTIKLTINSNDTNKCMDKYSSIILAGKIGVDCKTDFDFSVDLTNSSVSFLDQSVGFGNPIYLWDFGDNKTSDIQMPSHTFKGGFYNVCLNVLDTISLCKNFICKNIKVDALNTSCLASFIYNINSVNNEVTFSDNSVGNINSWSWEFGDNTVSYIQNPVHIYNNTGYFKIHLRSGDTVSGCRSDYISLIGIGSAYHHLKGTFSIFTDSSSQKKGVFPVDFKGANYGDASEVSWDFGDGTSSSSSMSPSHVYSQSADSIYKVCLTISDAKTLQSDQYCDSIKVLGSNGVHDLNMTVTSFEIFPNPANSNTIISYQLQNNDLIQIKVTDMVGHEITMLLSKKQNAGVYNLNWNTSDLNAGIYFIQLNTSNKNLIKKIIKLK